jgi:putative transposase
VLVRPSASVPAGAPRRGSRIRRPRRTDRATWCRWTSSARGTSSGVRFHALNQIDVASHHAGIEIVRDRSDRTVLVALHALWGRHGVPGRIQFDNGGPFVSPTGLGEVVRVCLRQGATPVFVPPREPWRNGTIEHFNDTFDKRFFRQERFADVEQLTGFGEQRSRKQR